jgi:DNA-binding CsgD family transcriptional regulator
MNGDRREANALLDEFLPLLRVIDPLTEAGTVVAAAAQGLFWLERDEDAAALLERVIGSARRASAPAALLLPLCCRADLDVRLGRWPVAMAEAQEAASLGDDMAQSAYTSYAFQMLARATAAQGDERACRQYADQALRLVDTYGNELGRLYVMAALALLELGLGRPEAALAHLEPAGARHRLREPNVVHWQADHVEAQVRAGDMDGARSTLRDFESQARQTGGRWALGTAARCRGLLADDDEAADACFGESLAHLEAARAPFEIARTRLCHGERLRRSGRRVESRRALRAAIDGFTALGSKAWLERALIELRATGAKARKRTEITRDELTAHELQVALVVARGATNREAAAALFLSPKTIEFHLAHVYRKLGLRTRTELAAHAARHGWLDED